MRLSRPILRQVLLPLGGFAALCLVIAIWVPAEGLFMNLATELIGIGIGTAYVDWILRQHERKQWSGARQRIYLRVQMFANRAITSVRASLGISASSIFQLTDVTGRDGTLVFLDFVEDKLAPRIASIPEISPEQVERLALALKENNKEVDAILTSFGAQIDAPEYDALLSVQDGVKIFLTKYDIIPEAFELDHETGRFNQRQLKEILLTYIGTLSRLSRSVHETAHGGE